MKGAPQSGAEIRTGPTPKTPERPYATTPIRLEPDHPASSATENVRIKTPSIRNPAERNAVLGSTNVDDMNPKK